MKVDNWEILNRRNISSLQPSKMWNTENNGLLGRSITCSVINGNIGSQLVHVNISVIRNSAQDLVLNPPFYWASFHSISWLKVPYF